MALNSDYPSIVLDGQLINFQFLHVRTVSILEFQVTIVVDFF